MHGGTVSECMVAAVLETQKELRLRRPEAFNGSTRLLYRYWLLILTIMTCSLH
ncbi:hypothetical protein RchiOBHm_Chr6g0258671 [Rosa chinensis]|uniref:Uncharacterized protein n=1 Tax=Rosa chinensis TaxID=74649 RepID=A0A2P6PMN1_ROSCH|nr:hypothetical protein RchiOBHm_Chr6g0258671 [Rosa chinensis]